jgi:alpha-beta hydrolase superfamily lysophospholipase
MDEFTLEQDDGTEVFCRRWLPSGTPRALVVVVHGASEHSGRYDGVAGVLRDDGHAVYALDLRGHGHTAASTGRGRMGPRGMDAVLDDVDALIDRARTEAGHVPVVLVGHSMGSVVVQAYVARDADSVDGYALSGTMGLTEGTPEFRDGLRLAMEAGLADEPLDATGAAGASFESQRTAYDWLTRDEDEVDRYIADPLCGEDFPLTYGYVAEVLETVIDVMSPGGIARIPRRLPVLLLAGDADPVSENGVHVRALERRLRDAGLRVTSHYYAGARHEVFNEINRDEVHGDLLGWIRTAVVGPATPSS